MALFSYFGKKDRQPDGLSGSQEAPIDSANSVLPALDEPAVKSEAEQVRAQRDAARMTAEKIDAIESEIARDILKAPTPAADAPATGEAARWTPVKKNETNPSNPFQSTIIQVGIDQRNALREELDE